LSDLVKYLIAKLTKYWENAQRLIYHYDV